MIINQLKFKILLISSKQFRLEILLLFFITFNLAPSNGNAQEKDKPNNNTAGMVQSTNDKLTEENELKNKMINAELEELEKSNASPEEKQKKREEIYKASGGKPISNNTSSSLSNIIFKPRYFPTQNLDKLSEITGKPVEVLLINMVILNPAITLDFNNYNDKKIEAEISEFCSKTEIDEKLFVLYVLPNLSYARKYGIGNINSLKLFFANQPELLNYVPSRIFEMMQSSEGINKLGALQQELGIK